MGVSLASREPAVVYGAPPRADLLPPAEKERRGLARLQRRWVIAVLAVLALAVLVLLASVAVRVQAGMSVRSAEDQRTELQRQMAEYSEVSGLVAERNDLVARRGQAMVADMSWSRPYVLLVPALPPGASLTGFTAATGGDYLPNGQELGVKGVAIVESRKPIDQAIALDRFSQVDNVVDVDLLGLEQAEGVYTYKIYVAFDQGIYNKRFRTDSAAPAKQEDGQ